MGFDRDSDGNVTNPPIMAEYEAQLKEAHASADNDRIQAVQEDYHSAREELVKKMESKQRESDDEFNARQSRERDERGVTGVNDDE